MNPRHFPASLIFTTVSTASTDELIVAYRSWATTRPALWMDKDKWLPLVREAVNECDKDINTIEKQYGNIEWYCWIHYVLNNMEKIPTNDRYMDNGELMV